MTEPGHELAVPESEELVLPHNGVIVDLGDELAATVALDELRRMEKLMAEAKRALTAAIADRARIIGTKTLNLDGGVKAVVKGGRETVYDAEAIEQELRQLGMPENRIREVVREEVTYKVVAVEAKKAASANDEYAAVIEANRRVIDKSPSIEIEIPRKRS